MNSRWLLVASVALVSGSIAIGCGGGDSNAGVAATLVVVIERDAACDAGTGSGGAGGSGSTGSASATTGAGGDASTSTSSTTGATTTSSASSSSASGTGGAGGAMMCVPTKCDPKACGTFADNGCGDVLDCGDCGGATCGAANVCVCAPVVNSPESDAACAGIKPGTSPMFCGGFPLSPKLNKCFGEGPVIGGQPVTCCLP